MFSTRQRAEQLRTALKLVQSSFVSQWRDIGDNLIPQRLRFNSSDHNRGDRRNQKIIDSTGTFALRTMQAGMQSGLTSPARPWHRVTTTDPSLAELPAVKEWLHTVTERQRDIFARSNLYNALPVVYGDMGAFSTGCLFVEEDDEDVIRCTPIPVGSYLIANDHKLRVRVFIREFPMTIRQLVEKFGGDPSMEKIDWTKFSGPIKTAWDAGRYEETRDVVHCIWPNYQYDPSKLEAKHKPFRSVYYEAAAGEGDKDRLLEDKGFDEFPALTPRWSISGQDAWGTDGPGMTALGDIRALQLMRKRGAQALEKQINPPMTGPSSLRTAKASLLPGDITYLDVRADMQGFRPVHETRVDLNDLRVEAQDIRNLIRRAFYEDLFLMLAYSDPSRGAQPVTAREIEERHEEKLLALGPVLEQLNQDLLDPLIDRTFAIMLRRGLVPPPPTELEGQELKVEYISVLAQAQKSVALSGMDRLGQTVLGIAAIKPDVMDKVDWDQYIDEVGIATGVAPRIIVPDDKVAAIRDARAKAQQAAAQAEQIKTVGAGAKSLSQADTQGPNALTDILSGVRSAGGEA